MPRSFMIIHQRFGEENDLHDVTSSSDSERSGKTCHDRMHPGSPARSFVSYAPDSPEFKKRSAFPSRSLEKSASLSDGDSDSGCSSQADVRHELSPELEYNLGCPSGFSLLLELMTQSPRRYSSTRDALDRNIQSELKSPGTRQCKEGYEKEKAGSDFGEIKKLEIYSGSTGQIELNNKHKMHIYLRHENEASLVNVVSGGRAFKASENSKDFSEITISTKRENFLNYICKDKNVDANGTLDLQPSQITPIYDYRAYNDQESKMNHIQRRISFDEEHCKGQKAYDFSTVDTSNDQPIDYSQLSSRRNNNYREIQRGNMQNSEKVATCTKEEPESKVRKMSEEIYHTSKSMTVGGVATQKYEFILSPKMDGNGNLVLSQAQNLVKTSLQVEQNCAERSKETTQPRPFTATENDTCSHSNIQQSSPLTGSPASPLYYSSKVKQETSLDIAKAKYETQACNRESSGLTKSQLPYHPKLKYLLAASQYVSKTKPDESQAALATEVLSNPETKLYLQNQHAQADTLSKLKDPAESVSGNNSSQDQQIHSSELFHSLNYSPNSNHENTNQFIRNHASTFHVYSSSIDISKGSPVVDKQQTTQEMYQPQISTSPNILISNSFISNRSSDQFENSQDDSSNLYPSSPGEPMSPASLRDQQAALSELLFSTNRKLGVDPYACVDCAKRYSTSSNLARHRQTHRSVCDKKARKCPHCDKVYVSMPAFSMHVRTHNQGCECPHCGKKFSRPWLLQGHIRTHTGEKPFGCPQCGKSFADKSNLRAHIQTHSTEKPYVCGRCGKAFALKSYLYKHEESSCMRGQRFRH